MQPFFVTSSGTDIGKTLVTAALCWQLRRTGRTVTALKPVISGYDPKDASSDSATILKSLGITPTPQLVETISPWHYGAAQAPAMAAVREGNPVDMERLLAFCREHAALQSDIVLVEGAGGVMAPLTGRDTMLDWMAALGWPVILVVGSYLGSISHTLTAFDVLQSRGVPVRALVVSESEHSTVALDATAAMLEKFLPAPIPLVKIPRLYGRDDLWQQAPPITWICDT